MVSPALRCFILFGASITIMLTGWYWLMELRPRATGFVLLGLGFSMLVSSAILLVRPPRRWSAQVDQNSLRRVDAAGTTRALAQSGHLWRFPLGFLSIVPLIVWIGLPLIAMLTVGTTGMNVAKPPLIFVLYLLLASALLQAGLYLVYSLMAYNNLDLEYHQRVKWLVFLAILASVAIPIYWLKYVLYENPELKRGTSANP